MQSVVAKNQAYAPALNGGKRFVRRVSRSATKNLNPVLNERVKIFASVRNVTLK